MAILREVQSATPLSADGSVSLRSPLPLFVRRFGSIKSIALCLRRYIELMQTNEHHQHSSHQEFFFGHTYWDCCSSRIFYIVSGFWLMHPNRITCVTKLNCTLETHYFPCLDEGSLRQTKFGSHAMSRSVDQLGIATMAIGNLPNNCQTKSGAPCFPAA